MTRSHGALYTSGMILLTLLVTPWLTQKPTTCKFCFFVFFKERLVLEAHERIACECFAYLWGVAVLQVESNYEVRGVDKWFGRHVSLD